MLAYIHDIVIVIVGQMNEVIAKLILEKNSCIFFLHFHQLRFRYIVVKINSITWQKIYNNNINNIIEFLTRKNKNKKYNQFIILLEVYQL